MITHTHRWICWRTRNENVSGPADNVILLAYTAYCEFKIVFHCDKRVLKCIDGRGDWPGAIIRNPVGGLVPKTDGEVVGAFQLESGRPGRVRPSVWSQIPTSTAVRDVHTRYAVSAARVLSTRKGHAAEVVAIRAIKTAVGRPTFSSYLDDRDCHHGIRVPTVSTQTTTRDEKPALFSDDHEGKCCHSVRKFSSPKTTLAITFSTVRPLNHKTKTFQLNRLYLGGGPIVETLPPRYRHRLATRQYNAYKRTT